MTVRPEVVHAHWIVPAGLVAWMLRRLSGAPYVVTVHGADAFTLTSGPASWLKRVVVRGLRLDRARQRGDRAGPSPGVGPSLLPLPMGVDVASIRAEVGPRRPEAGRILFVGRLVEKKGVDVLCAAVAKVPGVHLVVAGGGPLRSQLLEQAEALGHRRPDRASSGRAARAEVMAELARAAVVAIPSRVGADGDADGVPVVLGEAMAAGVPVVVSRQGGLAEHVTDGVNGLLTEPGSVDELAATLSRLTSRRRPWRAPRRRGGSLRRDGFSTSTASVTSTPRSWLRPTR